MKHLADATTDALFQRLKNNITRSGVDLIFSKKTVKSADLGKTLDEIQGILFAGSRSNRFPNYFGKWNCVQDFFLRWAKRVVFTSLTARHAGRHGCRDFKVIAASLSKEDKNACHYE